MGFFQRLLKPQPLVNYDVVMGLQAFGLLIFALLVFMHLSSRPDAVGNMLMSQENREWIYGVKALVEEVGAGGVDGSGTGGSGGGGGGGDADDASEIVMPGVAQGWWIIFAPFLLTAPWQMYVRSQWVAAGRGEGSEEEAVEESKKDK